MKKLFSFLAIFIFATVLFFQNCQKQESVNSTTTSDLKKSEVVSQIKSNQDVDFYSIPSSWLPDLENIDPEVSNIGGGSCPCTDAGCPGATIQWRVTAVNIPPPPGGVWYVAFDRFCKSPNNCQRVFNPTINTIYSYTFPGSSLGCANYGLYPLIYYPNGSTSCTIQYRVLPSTNWITVNFTPLTPAIPIQFCGCSG